MGSGAQRWCQGGEGLRSPPAHLSGRRSHAEGRWIWTRAEGTCPSTTPASETEGFPKQASCLISARSQGRDYFEGGERGGPFPPKRALALACVCFNVSPCLPRVWSCAHRVSWWWWIPAEHSCLYPDTFCSVSSLTLTSVSLLAKQKSQSRGAPSEMAGLCRSSFTFLR